MAMTTEGYISEIVLDSSATEVRFKIDPTVPYLIENGGDKDKREIILRDGSTAKVVPDTCEFLFKAPKGEEAYKFDVNSLLIMKACRVKVKLTVEPGSVQETKATIAEMVAV